MTTGSGAPCRVGIVGSGFTARNLIRVLACSEGLEISRVLTRRPFDSIKGIGQKDRLTYSVNELIDDSEKHRGHGGWREGGESHFRLRMISAAFEGQSRVQRQRAVNKVLADELAGPVHALSMDLRAPGE